MHVAYLEAKMLIHQAWKAHITLLLAKKVTVLDEYLDFAKVFSKKSATELPKRFDTNENAIDLKSGK